MNLDDGGGGGFHRCILGCAGSPCRGILHRFAFACARPAFFAIRGPRFDGHQFVGQALERGAAGVVVEEAFFASAPAEWRARPIAVADTRSALQTLAREVRRKWGKRLVAVTGSAGKSTTKEMIAAILSRRFRVLRSPGNLNNDFGLPLALLGLEPEHEVAVMELAMSAAGEIARLARLAEPRLAS